MAFDPELPQLPSTPSVFRGRNIPAVGNIYASQQQSCYNPLEQRAAANAQWQNRQATGAYQRQIQQPGRTGRYGAIPFGGVAMMANAAALSFFAASNVYSTIQINKQRLEGYEFQREQNLWYGAQEERRQANEERIFSREQAIKAQDQRLYLVDQQIKQVQTLTGQGDTPRKLAYIISRLESMIQPLGNYDEQYEDYQDLGGTSWENFGGNYNEPY